MINVETTSIKVEVIQSHLGDGYQYSLQSPREWVDFASSTNCSEVFEDWFRGDNNISYGDPLDILMSLE